MSHEAVTIDYVSADLQSRTPIEAYTTSTKGIVVHPAGVGVMWAVTVASCGTRLAKVESREAANLVAGAMAGFPIAWDRIPAFKTRQDATKVVDVLKKRLEASNSSDLLFWLSFLAKLTEVTTVAKQTYTPAPTSSVSPRTLAPTISVRPRNTRTAIR